MLKPEGLSGDGERVAVDNGTPGPAAAPEALVGLGVARRLGMTGKAERAMTTTRAVIISLAYGPLCMLRDAGRCRII